ncbi:substrate-binding periplasmic protein [Silvanigrella sp.]|jgi:ABC-type amino acid transport substrate-binding protein|uniref:substrate-binding periplasmic protein n=1 Tax=Silvanigrella sp. TaxID=2024976 RepID=UPI0037CC6689
MLCKNHLLGGHFDDKVCFFTLKKNKPINDKKDLLSLKRIGIIRGGAEEIILKDLNLTKSIDESNTHQSLIQKLFAERLDAILLGSLTANLLWHNNGYPQDQLQCGRPYTYNSQFIAASLSSDNEFIKTISIAMENFKKTPDYINILQKYEIKDINKIKTIQEEIKK